MRPIHPSCGWGCLSFLIIIVFTGWGVIMLSGEKPIHVLSTKVAQLTSQSLVFAANHEVLFQDDVHLTVYGVVTGSQQQQFDLTVSGQSVALSPDEHWLALGKWDGTVQLRRYPTGELVQTMQPSPSHMAQVAVPNLTFTPDSQQVLVAVAYKDIVRASVPYTIEAQLWSLDPLQRVQVLDQRRAAYGTYTLSTDGTLLLFDGDTIDLRRLRDPQPLFQSGTAAEAVALSHDSQWLAVGRRTGVTIYQVSTGQSVDTLPVRAERAPVLAWSADGQVLAVGDNHSVGGSLFVGAPTFPRYERITIYRTRDWQPIQTLQGHRDGTSFVTFSPDNQYLASMGGDHQVRVWRVEARSAFWSWLPFGGALLLVVLPLLLWVRRGWQGRHKNIK